MSSDRTRDLVQRLTAAACAFVVVAAMLALAAPAAEAAGRIATRTTVAASTDSPIYGETITGTATIADGVEGTVQFGLVGAKDRLIGDPVAVDDGTATSIGFRAAAGSYTLEAVFTPTDSATYAGSSADTGLDIAGAPTTLTLTVTPDTIVADVTVDSRSDASPDGDLAVQFIMDGNTITYADVQNGEAEIAYAVPTDHEHEITATYLGSFGNVYGSSETYERDNPTISAAATSTPGPSEYGWRRSATTVTFSCALADSQSPISGGCPDPVTVSKEGAGQVVSRTITTADGGSATAAVGLYLDLTKPTVSVADVTNGRRYYGASPKIRCVGSDTLSGVASCDVTRRIVKRSVAGNKIRYTATATDEAGNTATATGTYQQLSMTVDGAAYHHHAYRLTLGKTYKLLASAATKPSYVGAVATPGVPTGSGKRFTRAGSFAGTPCWTRTVKITKSFAKHAFWNLGIRIGSTTKVIRIHVVR